MACATGLELKRRTIVKSLLWRLIGIIWTWLGAFLILVLTPEKYKSASLMATAIVIYHHSTRMVMYYFHERIWNKVIWGKIDEGKLETAVISSKEKVLWIFAVMLILMLIFFLILYVNPLIKR